MKRNMQEVSSFGAGEWLVDLLCLIPIHVAVTRDNRFVPLKDGIWSTHVERSLLGATVDQIVDSLSFGWYESIFQSYMASKVRHPFLPPFLKHIFEMSTAGQSCVIDG